jgi:hypothetical protein
MFHIVELVHYVQGAYDPTQQVGGNNVTLEVQYGLATTLIKKGACFTPKAKQQWQGLLYPVLEVFIVLCNG